MLNGTGGGASEASLAEVAGGEEDELSQAEEGTLSNEFKVHS